MLLFFRYADRPGVVGTIGTILGEAGVNIAAMQVARREAGGEALMTLTVDSSVDAELLADGRRARDRLVPAAASSTCAASELSRDAQARSRGSASAADRRCRPAGRAGRG